jgi:probable F420-dependent oxidoreductase
MPPLRPFRFGAAHVQLPTQRAWAEWARTVEGLGYHRLLMGDHFGLGFAPAPALLAAALATTTLRIGTTVYAADFRHPALLANEAATLDVLSGGRFEFGIGAGYNRAEYAAAGIPFDPPAIRVSRMIEALGIIKALWRGETVQFTGQHYTIQGLRDPVRPVQQPHPPIFVGGGGRRVLSFAAREADRIGLIAQARRDGARYFGEDDYEDDIARKVGWIRAAAGDRLAQLELGVLVRRVRITDDPRGAAEQAATELRDVLSRDLTVERVLGSCEYLLGSVESITARLLELRERLGLSAFTVYPQDVETFAPIVARLSGH